MTPVRGILMASTNLEGLSMDRSVALCQIEQAAQKLSSEECLWLIERLVHRLRRKNANGNAPVQAVLAEMAADPEIQREIAQIDREFSFTENDGLE